MNPTSLTRRGALAAVAGAAGGVHGVVRGLTRVGHGAAGLTTLPALGALTGGSARIHGFVLTSVASAELAVPVQVASC